jgi:arginine deiminase
MLRLDLQEAVGRRAALHLDAVVQHIDDPINIYQVQLDCTDLAVFVRGRRPNRQ